MISKETEKLGYDIVNNYSNWTQNRHTFSNGKLEIWTANGLLFIDTYPETHVFNIFEKIYLKNCIKTAIIKKGLEL